MLSRYELRRTLKSKAILIIVPIMIVLSLLIAYGTVIVSSSSSLFIETGGYIKDNIVHILIVSYGSYGNPIGGIEVNINYNGLTKRVVTSSSGLTEITFPYDNKTNKYSYSYLASFSAGSGEVYLNGNFLRFSQIYRGADSVKVLIFYIPRNGDLGNILIYYKLQMLNSSQQTQPIIVGSPNSVNITEYKLYGRLENYAQLVTLSVPNSTSLLNIALVNSSNNKVIGNLQTIVFPPPSVASQFTYIVVSPIFSLLPIMIVILSYSLYAKDKTTGVLEYILSKPVSRLGLIITKYLGISIGALIASLLSISIVLIISRVLFDFPISVHAALIVSGSLVLELFAFLALLFLIAQFTSSSGMYLGIVISLYIIFGFFYSLVIYIVQLVLGNIILAEILELLNPLNIGTLIVSSYLGISTLVTSPPLWVIILAGILWLIVPLILISIIVNRRD